MSNQQEVKFNISIDLPTAYGTFKLYHYSHINNIESMTFNEHLGKLTLSITFKAIVKGDVSDSDEPILCRIHVNKQTLNL
jgi:GTP cyclohydrolase II